jgi:pimeloyl-ACP methyl ester carboxylesterase
LKGFAAAVSICILIASLVAVPRDAGAQDEAPWNLPTPTLGGTQLWRDSHVFAGWRIQENVLTGHFRLLDPEDTRRVWGSYAQVKERLDDLRRIENIQPPSKHLVLLVHGILRSTGTFSALEKALIEAGFDAVAISYPSTRATIEEHAEGLARLLDRQEGTETVSFVTHSMGGLVVRHLLSRDEAWQRRIAVHRIVLIAPPNQGSAVARLLKDIPAYRMIYGAAGQQLTPAEVSKIPLIEHPFAIVAGGTGDGEGFNPLLPGDDDGTVGLAETRLEGTLDFLVVPEIHAVISNHQDTIRATINFLKHGKFDAAP